MRLLAVDRFDGTRANNAFLSGWPWGLRSAKSQRIALPIADEVSWRAGPWKWPGNPLLDRLRPVLSRFARGGCWVPRIRPQEGSRI